MDTTALTEQFSHFRGLIECWTHTWGLRVLPDQLTVHVSVRLFVVYVCPVASSATCPGCHLWDRLRGRCTTQEPEVSHAV